jgi:hypothetical protein
LTLSDIAVTCEILSEVGMRVGDEVRTGVPLPGIPIGTVGSVKEVGRLFVAVDFDDGHIGYYAQPQLSRTADCSPQSDEAQDDADLGFAQTRVPYGSHLCLLPPSQRESAAVAAQYVAAGVRGGDNCVCAVPYRYGLALRRGVWELGVDPDRAVNAGTLSIVSNTDVYLQGNEFTAARQLERSLKAYGALSHGPAQRLRCMGYPASVLRDMDPEEWWEYERRVTPLLKMKRLLALCVYDARGVGSTQWKRAEALHPYTVRAGRLLVTQSTTLA